jgi:hypothetical protein
MSSHGAARPRPHRGYPSPPLAAASRLLRHRALALIAVVTLALTTGAVTLLLARSDAERLPGTPTEASAAQLRSVAAKADAPVYWAGTRPGKRFELTRTRAGRFFVRYLPSGVKAGDRRPAFLTVGTYPQRRAYTVTDASSRRAGMVHRPTPGGGLAVWRRRRPSNVYLAYPGSDQLVEVFSPDAAAARRLVLAGVVGPVGEVPAAEPDPRTLKRPADLSR